MAKKHNAKRIALAGGVAANAPLRERCKALAEENGMEFVCPSMPLCTDNAAMIGCAAYYEWKNGARADMTLNAVANLPLD